MTVSLSDLVDAIANAVIEAQDRVERHQVALLQNYFDEDGRPLTQKLRVPSMRDDAETFDEDELEVPLLALVGTSRLAIKELTISTAISLGDLEKIAEANSERASVRGGVDDAKSTDTDQATTQFTAARGTRERSLLQLDLGASKKDPASATAQMSLKVEAQEPSEGIARLIIELNKRIRTYPIPS